MSVSESVRVTQSMCSCEVNFARVRLEKQVEGIYGKQSNIDVQILALEQVVLGY
jgi:hypothetical protein